MRDSPVRLADLGPSLLVLAGGQRLYRDRYAVALEVAGGRGSEAGQTDGKTKLRQFALIVGQEARSRQLANE